MIHEHVDRFRRMLIIETGDREMPVSKIEVSEAVWNKILFEVGDKLNWVDDGNEIKLIQLVGVEIVKRSVK